MISKRLLSALFLLAVAYQGVYAQYNYAQWRIYTEDNDGNVSSVNFRSDYNLFQKQTKEFDGKKYSPIRMLDGSGKTIYCRTEDERIMRYDETEGAEFVLFDFSLGLGRSFSCKDGTELVVYEVKDTLFEDVFGADPATQRLIKLYNRRYPSRKDLWLENFGSLKTSVLLPSELGTEIRDSHVAWWDSYAFETTFNNIDTEKLKGQPLRRTERDDYWRPDSLHCELEGDTLVVSGRLRASGCIWPYLTCVTDGNTITLELDDTPGDRWSGFPSYYFRNEFPGFKPGEYTLSYDNRISITFDSKRSYDIPVLWGEVKNQDGIEVRNATVTYYEGTRDNIENADILAEGKTDIFGLYMMYLHLPHDTELTEKDVYGWPIEATVEAEGCAPLFRRDLTIGQQSDFMLYDKATFKAGRTEAIISPVAPDPQAGAYYRMDKVVRWDTENRIGQPVTYSKVYMKRTMEPEANVPYIFIPHEDYSISLKGMDLSQKPEFISMNGVSFGGTYNCHVVELIMSYNAYDLYAFTDYEDYTNGDWTDQSTYTKPLHAWFFCKHNNYLQFVYDDKASTQDCDVNKDGKVDITDVVGVINTIAGDTRYKDTSDVNSDGRTDITDVVDIINVIAGQ